jgi:hypothetical protein
MMDLPRSPDGIAEDILYYADEEGDRVALNVPVLLDKIAEAIHVEQAVAERLRDEVERLKKVLNEVRQTLRIECADIDANDWPDDLHPADVIEKYLCRTYRRALGEK